MFNSGILDVVIGLVVVYLQLSLVCTAIHELTASFFQKRAKELERGIGQLLTNPQLVAKFYSHPLIKGLRPDGNKPSYIPSRVFALTVMDIVRRHSFDGTLSLATQAVTDRTSDAAAAEASFNEASANLVRAQALRQAQDNALAANVGDKVEATNRAKIYAQEEAAINVLLTKARIKLDAANQAQANAEAYLAQVTTDTTNARTAETAAQAAEAAAAAAPKDTNLQKAAAIARQRADEAAYKLAPSASSLLSEARDKVAAGQSDVVPPELKAALLALIDNAGTNLNKAQANLEQWFNDAMDRVSGVYKRKSQVWVVVIAALVTISANVDSLQVADSLSRDKALRESLVAAAPALAEADKDAVNRERGGTPPTPPPTPSPVASPSVAPAKGPNQKPPATQAPLPTPSPTPAAAPSPSPSLSSIRASLEEIKKLGVPLGYIRVCTPGEEKLVENNCPNAVDAAVIDADASLKKAQEDLDKANATLQKVANAKAAVDSAQKAVEEAKSKRAQAEKSGEAAKAAADDVLTKAQAELDKADAELQKTNGDAAAVEATRQLASAQVLAAKVAHDQALKAAVAAKQVEADAVSAEAKAQSLRAEASASPHTTQKDDAAATAENAAEAARRKANDQKEMLRLDCPKCRKESELSASELKQRMPTTHGYRLASWDLPSAIGALIGDSWDLLYAHWLGWLLTAMAISMGAPFWFDTLNRLMVIRSTVKPHEKSKDQESKDNPDEKDEPSKS
jgi:hypothetical protein